MPVSISIGENDQEITENYFRFFVMITRSFE
jgi:hypothetical protein